MRPKAIILRGYGFNAEAELARAFELAGAGTELVHLGDFLAEPGLLDRAGILAFPGGFSFGDHLGSGQVVALLCRRALRPAIESFVARGGLVIGVCNGFQVLAKMGVLPNRPAPARGRGDAPATVPGGAAETWVREVSLVHNESGRFVDEWTPLRFEASSRCLWTRGLPGRLLPIRHGEGRFVARDDAVLDALEAEGLVALRYAPAPGEANPNGSARDIAGITDPSGRVLGLMPHPEAFLVPENHPYRRRGRVDPPGIDLFERGVAAARDAL